MWLIMTLPAREPDTNLNLSPKKIIEFIFVYKLENNIIL